MKNFFVTLFFLILVISVLYFDFLEWNQFDEKTQLIAVVYQAENCPSCKELNQKMHKIEWLFAQKPIVFIHYDIHQAVQGRFIRKIGFDEIAKKEMGAGFVVIYDRPTKQSLLKIPSHWQWEQIQESIEQLLEKQKHSKP